MERERQREGEREKEGEEKREGGQGGRERGREEERRKAKEAEGGVKRGLSKPSLLRLPKQGWSLYFKMKQGL